MPVVQRLHRTNQREIDLELDRICKLLSGGLDADNLNLDALKEPIGKIFEDGQLSALERFLDGTRKGRKVRVQSDQASDYVFYAVNDSATSTQPTAFLSGSSASAPVALLEQQGNGDVLRLHKKGAGVGSALVIDYDGNDLPLYVELPSAGTALLSSDGIWTDACSSQWKLQVAPVDTDAILRGLRSLQISLFRGKGSAGKPGEALHIGPMAEDLHATFGLGNDRGVSGRDLAAIACAGVQSLAVRLDRLEALVVR